MGFGLPSAIGAKLAKPNSIVINIDGDASFNMTAMELMTAKQFNINIKVVIINNGCMGMVKQWQNLFYEKRLSGTEIINPDFVLLAQVNSNNIRPWDVNQSEFKQLKNCH